MPVVINGTTGVNTPAPLSLSSTTLSTAVPGNLEYDGRLPYFVPQGVQRGVIPGMQFYRLDSALAGANVNTAQNLFGVGVTLSSSTVYKFEAVFALSKASGTTSHTLSALFGGTATINNIMWGASGTWFGTTAAPNGYASAIIGGFSSPNNNTTQLMPAQTNATVSMWFVMQGTVSINAGGTFAPQYILSAAPGSAYSTLAGSYFSIYPIGASGSNISVGAWA